MKRQVWKRGLAVALSAAVCVTLSAGFTMSADAASKKTVYVMVQSNTTYNNGGSIEKGMVKNTYDKNGLLKQMVSTGITADSRTVYKRDKAGIVKSAKTYNGAGKLTGATENTIKKGLVTKTKYYDITNGKKKLSTTTTYTYKKKKYQIKTI